MNDSTAPAESTTTQLDAEHPWLGLASFTEETRAYFYGRDDEIAELARRVQRKTLTLLFGQSGLGKTSILRAGIVPKLRGLGHCPVYVRVDYTEAAPLPSEQIKDAIFRATGGSSAWTQPGVAVAGESLWEFLHHRGDVLQGAAGQPLIPLLIFDQFEEIFTLAQSDDAGRARAAQFIDDLADLVENRPPKALEAAIDIDESLAERFDFARSDYRVLIALREDYLAQLESVKAKMPSVTQNRMRLARMTGEQALAAVVNPGGKLVTEEVAEAIVRFVAGGAELRNAEVEPSLLSLICRELNNARVAQGAPEISAALLAGSRDTILSEFYERALADQPEGVRRYIEDELLTDSGFRESVAEERVRKAFDAAAAPRALATLVDRRLLRIEERLDLRRVELTHDVLCGVVATSRNLRHEREARDEAEHALAEQQARELATHRALVRARRIAAGCAVLAVVAIGGAIFGYLGMKRAQQAEAAARQTRALADSARGEAEKLIVYLLDDFYRELEPIGRLDIVASLAKRAVDYYDGLPAALRTPETERNRALALVRYGAALRNQSKLAEAGKALDQAVAELERLRAAGDRSEATAIGLALGLSSQARVAGSQNRLTDEIALGRRSVDVLDPLVQAPSPSIALRRAYATVAMELGFAESNGGLNEQAVQTLDAARAASRSIADLELDDIPAATLFAEATAWQASALVNLGQLDRLRSNAQDARDVIDRVLAVQPGNMSALRSDALLDDSLASADGSDLHAASALALETRVERDWQALIKLDPTNQIAWHNLASARFSLAAYRFDAGDPVAARAALWSALAIEPQMEQTASTGSVLGLVSGNLAQAETNLGNDRAAKAAVASNQRYIELAIRDQPAGSFARVILPENLGNGGNSGVWPGYGQYAIAYGRGDFAAIRARALASAARLEAASPPNAGAREVRDQFLDSEWRTAADASLRLGDVAGARDQIARALDLRRQLPQRNLGDRRDANNELALAAMIAARAGDEARARAIIAPVLEFDRGLYRRSDNDDVSQHFEYARALYAAALAEPSRKAATLAEASRVIDGLPAAMRALLFVERLRSAIAAEQHGESATGRASGNR